MFSGSRFGGGAGFLSGVAFLIVVPILTRVYAEILIVVFQMHKRLGDIHDVLAHSQTPVGGASSSPAVDDAIS